MASAVDAAGPLGGESKLPPLAMSAQVGTVRKGVQGGGEFNCCNPAHWLDRPMIPEGEVKGQGWG
jgi:hypothetical protein